MRNASLPPHTSRAHGSVATYPEEANRTSITQPRRIVSNERKYFKLYKDQVIVC